MVPVVRSLLAIAAASVLLTGCGRAPSAVAPAQSQLVSSGSAMAAKASLKSHTKKVFTAVFTHYDANGDKKWSPEDFELTEDRFNNIFRNVDTDDDKIVTPKEYFSDERLAEKVEYFESRAKVSGMTGGRMGIDNTVYILEFYLKPFLNKEDRRQFIETAFERCDANKDGVLNRTELAFAYAVVEAKADEKDIERKVNRSKGQPDKPKND